MSSISVKIIFMTNWMFFPVKMTKSKFRKVKIGIDIYVLQVRWPKSLYIFGKRCENAKKSVIFCIFSPYFHQFKNDDPPWWRSWTLSKIILLHPWAGCWRFFCPNPKKNYDCYHYFDKLNRFNIRDTFLRRKIIDMHALPTIVLLLSTNLVMATREIEPIYWNVNNKR